MRLDTWNVNSLNVRLEQVLAWLSNSPVGSRVDVLVLQETKLSDDMFPFQAFTRAGYELSFFGQKTYNGVALVSRHPISSVIKNLPTFDDPMARVISAQVLGLRIIGA